MNKHQNNNCKAHRTKTLLVRLTEEEYLAIEAIAARNACSGATVMTSAIRDYMTAENLGDQHIN